MDFSAGGIGGQARGRRTAPATQRPSNRGEPVMDTNPSTSTLSHQHDWPPIDGWCARYRCKGCRIVGYRPRVVTLGVDGGPYGRTAITPYVCASTRGGM